MELVTKKRLHLVAVVQRRTSALPGDTPAISVCRSARPTSPSGRRPVRSTAASATACAAPTCSSCRATSCVRGPLDQRRDHGHLIMVDAAERGVGQARSPPSARCTATPARTASPTGVSPSRPSSSPTCSASPGRTGSSRGPALGQIQGFFDGPVDHSPLCPSCRGDDQDWARTSSASPRTPAGVKVAERCANCVHADLAIVHKRHMTGEKNVVEARKSWATSHGRTCAARASTTPSTPGDHRRRGRAAQGATAPTAMHAAPPTLCCRARDRPHQELGDDTGHRDRHGPAATGEAARADRGALRGRCPRRRHRRRLRGHVGQRDLRRAQPGFYLGGRPGRWTPSRRTAGNVFTSASAATPRPAPRVLEEASLMEILAPPPPPVASPAPILRSVA